MIGRERERDPARALLLDPDVRLVTLTDPVSAGKTRLALEVARWLEDDVADGVAFGDLTAVTDPDLVLPVIAPLTLPPCIDGPQAPDEVAKSEAVRLFLGRAQATRTGFRLTAENAPASAAIRRDLDGLPRAIELAAQMRVLPQRVLFRRLELRLPLPDIERWWAAIGEPVASGLTLVEATVVVGGAAGTLVTPNPADGGER